LLAGLEPGFVVGVADGERVPAGEIDGASLGRLLQQFGQPAPALSLPGGPVRFFEVVRSLARAETVAAGPSLEEAARAALGAL
ncbi:hypothetical protein LWS67_24985, partial [Bacillus atrophaeus]|uniref:hypothetical protein n=1 Tax=Bacillus atrophaeus TaxID=1452 RepID=UPI001EFBF7D1